AGPADDIDATISYTSCPDTNVNVANGITVTGGGVEMRRRESSIDCATGNVTQVREFLAGGVAAVTDLSYTSDAMLKQYTGPATVNGQRTTLSYDYDTPTRTYVEKVTDNFGLTSSSTHDLRFGTTLTTADVNGNQATYAYDPFGRTTSITGPNELGTGSATIRFEYHADATVPWALTHHLDTFRDVNDPIDTVSFIDGLGRMIQTKKDATVFT